MMQSAVRSEAGCGRAAASSTPEADLIKRAQAFDEGAISFIFDNYYPRVYNYGLIQVRDVQAAEDLASDVMLRVLEAIPRYRARGVPLSAWIFRIARNRLVDIRRNRTRRREVGLEDSQIAAPGSPHASVERALNYGQVCTALEKLTYWAGVRAPSNRCSFALWLLCAASYRRALPAPFLERVTGPCGVWPVMQGSLPRQPARRTRLPAGSRFPVSS